MKKYNTGDKVKIIKINNVEKAIHLIKFINSEAEIISWVAYSSGLVKYKLMLDNNVTAYFREDEIELV